MFTEKNDVRDSQLSHIFTYVITNTGETLDAQRFETVNDLPEMVKNFRLFHALPEEYHTKDPKCKIWPIDKFSPENHWSVDRWWTAKERISLGIDDEKTITDPIDFKEVLNKHKDLVLQSLQRLENAQKTMPKVEYSVEVSLSNENYFNLSIGKRVLKKEVYNQSGDVPVYSANVKEPFGWMTDSNIKDFTKPYVLWGIDGNFDFSVKMAGEIFRTTDHCGSIKIEHEDINPMFVYYSLHAIREENRLDRELRANLKNIQKFNIRFPIKVDENKEPLTVTLKNKKTGEMEEFNVLDSELQQKIVEYYTEFEEVKAEIYRSALHINGLEMETIKD